jgi:Tfp pilus assembly protein PilX
MRSCETVRPPRGAALVVTLLVMAVLLLAGTTFMTIASTESQIALSERASIEALGIAEAGLRRAILKVSDPATYPGYASEVNSAVGRGFFTVAVSNATTQACSTNDGKSILVTARVPVLGANAQVLVDATLDRLTAPYRYAAFATVPNQVVYDSSASSPLRQVFGVDRQESELWLGTSAQTDSFNSALGAYHATTNRGADGTIGGNADVKLDGSVQVNGSAKAGDGINAGSGVTVSGNRLTGLAPATTSPGETFAPIDMPTNLGAPWALDLTLPQWVSYTTFTISAGTYYVTTINMPDNRTLTPSGGIVTIYVAGNVTIGNNVTLGAQPPTNLRIITKSDAAMTTNPETASFIAGNNFRYYGALYGRNTNVGIGTDAQIYGSLIGRTIVVGARTQLHYDVALRGIRHCSSGRYTIRPGTWREVLPY